MASSVAAGDCPADALLLSAAAAAVAVAISAGGLVGAMPGPVPAELLLLLLLGEEPPAAGNPSDVLG